MARVEVKRNAKEYSVVPKGQKKREREQVIDKPIENTQQDGRQN